MTNFHFYQDIPYGEARQRFARAGVVVGIVFFIFQVLTLADRVAFDFELGRFLSAELVKLLVFFVVFGCFSFFLAAQVVATVVSAGHGWLAGALPAPLPFPLPALAGRVVSPATPPPRFSLA